MNIDHAKVIELFHDRINELQAEIDEKGYSDSFVELAKLIEVRALLARFYALIMKTD